jgi:hypothetical protein
MMLAANARIIVQCFLERLPFDVLEDDTVWIAPNKTVIQRVALKAVKGRVWLGVSRCEG